MYLPSDQAVAVTITAPSDSGISVIVVDPSHNLQMFLAPGETCPADLSTLLEEPVIIREAS